jgi:flagellar biosynthesis/type III secretory pathway M-ring protein FliF/YscJ
VNLELLAALLAGGSLIVSLAVLVLVWRVLRNARRSRAASDERLEILREQQERLKIMGQERSMLKEELERLRSVLEEVEEERQLELTAPAEAQEATERPEQRSWWQRWFGA